VFEIRVFMMDGMSRGT